jgi:host factor-I protein
MVEQAWCLVRTPALLGFSVVDKRNSIAVIRADPTCQMTSESAPNLQDIFLLHLQEQNVPVTVFLVNGVRLQGYVTHLDRYGVALTRDGQTQFVYKQAISAINPLTDLELASGPEEAGR